jgi:hypothetical protein
MIEFRNPVGSLLVTRWSQPLLLDELTSGGPAFFKVVENGDRWVLCCDLRKLVVLSPDVASAMVAVMKRDNPRIIRSAFVAPQLATLTLQLTRMLREAENPNRQMFHSPDAIKKWLADVLGGEEKLHLSAFLAEVKI